MICLMANHDTDKKEVRYLPLSFLIRVNVGKANIIRALSVANSFLNAAALIV